MYEDQEIIAGLKLEGVARRKAESRLFLNYSYFIEEGMKKFSLSLEHALNAYSDAVIVVINSLKKEIFENRSSIKTYLYSIFCNKCIDVIRKTVRDDSKTSSILPINEVIEKLSDSTKSIIQKLFDRYDSDFLKIKIQEMGDVCKNLITLFLEGYKDMEIAHLLDYSNGKVAQQTRLRCFNKLKKLYNE